jgi:DNA-binding transcriptional ArsR family regulator
MDAFEALADPTRRQIVAMLAASERTAGEIAGRFDIAGPSVSRHLKVLRDSGLITYRAEAQSRIYRLKTVRLEQVQQWMRAQIDLCRERFDRLEAHLERMEGREAKHAKNKRR